MIDERPLWHVRTRMHATSPSPLEACDALIVGGGITGLVAGIELRAAGLNVMICEASAPGEGASGRAFGSIAIGSAAAMADLIARFGRDRGTRLWLEASDAASALAAYIDRNSLDCDYRRTGHLRLAACASQESGLVADHRAWGAQLGEDAVHLLSADALRNELPGSAFRMALLDEATATIDPYRYVAALLARFLAEGGCYLSNCVVTAVVRGKDGFQIRHTGGETRAREVLVATNGQTGPLVPWLHRRVVQVGSYMVSTEPLPPATLALFHARRRVCTTAFTMKNYFRLDTEGQMVFGGRSSLSADRPLPMIAAELRSSMLGYFPMLEDIRIAHVWGGRLSFTFDNTPHLGQHDGLHHALGYCGRGLPMATQFGRAIASRMLGGPDLAPEHAATIFPQRWYYRGKPWFLPLVAAYYRRKDRLVRIGGI